MKKIFILLFFIFGLMGFFIFVTPIFASTEIGTIDDGFGYAWGDSSGWFNFDTAEGGVVVRDTGLSGYAWSENFGWINLSPPGSGVSNNNEGTLSGYAWGENTGWINFSGVSISSLGTFSGTASGDIIGTISFDCAGCTVTTDWRPASTRIVTNTNTGGGGLPAEAYTKPIPPFSILIDDGREYTKNSVVSLALNGGPDIKTMAISESPNFDNAVQEDYQTIKIFTLSQNDGQRTVYVKFYTKWGQSSAPVSDSIILDTKAPEINITYIKDKYGSEEEVILSGTAESKTEVFLYLDQQYSSFKVDGNGNWLVSLGKLSTGKHRIDLIPKDVAGNSGKPLVAEFSVEDQTSVPQSDFWQSTLEKIKQGIELLIPKFLKPGEIKPVEIIMVPQKAPISFAKKWILLPVEPIRRFVLSPLPKDVSVLAQKFPELQKTFEEVGVTKITDVEKLKEASLKLPGLTQTLGLAQVEIRPGQFSPPKGVPIADLSIIDKKKIPTEIVFSSTGGGLVDFNVALSINNKGKTEQTIKTIVGKPLELVVKPEKPVKKIMGYVVFRAKKPAPLSFQVPLNYLNASLMFAGPNLTENQDAPVNIEEKLVLLEFEYKDAGNGVYTATIQVPTVDGEYEIITVMDYEDPEIISKEIKLITVVDPEGYIYEKDGEKETRILGAVASLYWLNPETKQYELWPAREYQQENPQTTDVRGVYSFLVPEGYYYLKVDAPGYLSYDGKPFQVVEGSGVHINIELKTIYWWTKIIDWKMALLIIVILLLLYNFYRDKIREKNGVQNKIVN